MHTETLVDREGELLAIQGALTSGASGAGSFVLVSGRLGSGKTALLRVSAAMAREREYRVLCARGGHAETGLPFGLVARLFEPVLREADDEVERLLEASPRVWPMLGLAEVEDDVSAADLQALHRFLSALTRRGPIMLAVDDVQWADRLSLRWLTTLAGRVDHAPVVLVASLGHGEWGDRTDLVDDLVVGCTRELTLRDLGPAGTATALERMIDITPDRAFATVCVEATAGNPRLVAAVASAVREGLVLPYGPAALRDLPVTSGLSARLRRATPHAIDVVRAVAVLAAHATPERVAALTRLPVADVSAAVVVLRRMGVLAVDPLRVAQPLVRDAILAGVPGSVVVQSASVLRDVPDLADYLVRCPVIGEEWVVDALRRGAADALDDGRPGDAAEYLRRALLEPSVPRAAVLSDLGVALARTNVEAAIGCLREAVRLGTPPAPELHELLVLNGEERVAGSVDPLPEVPARYDPMVAEAARLQHEPMRANALAARAAARRALGELAGARQDAEDGLAALRRCGARVDGFIGGLLRGVLARTLVELDELDAARAVLDGPLADEPRGWDDIALLFARGLVSGRPDDFLACGRALKSWQVTNPAVLPWRSAAALAMDGTEARRLVDEEVALARACGVPGALGIALRAQGIVHRDVTPLIESLSVLDGWPAGIERVRTLLAHGRLVKERDVVQARELLHAAHGLARELGLSTLAARVSWEITSAGGRVRSTPRTGAAALTNAERRVVALALRGHTNQAMARQLCVGLRTVEIHLTNAYRKLGIRTRGELGEALGRAG